MIIDTVTVRNWMPFQGRFDLDLPSGPIAVVALSKDNPNRSNWSGKTALLEAIRWCLFGTHRKRYEDDVINRDENETSVAIVFTDGTRCSRSRRRGKATRVTFEQGDTVLKKRDAQDAIHRFLGLTLPDFEATLFFAQGDTTAIVQKTSGERRKVIAQWLELEAWDRIAASIRVEARRVADTLVKLRGHREVIEGRRDADGYFRDEEVETGNPVIDRALAQGRAAGAWFAARESMAEIQAEKQRIADNEIARLDAERFEQRKGGLHQIKSDLARLGKNTPSPDDLEEMDRAAELADQALGEASAAVRRARSALVDFDGQCPVMRRECPAAATVQEMEEGRREAYEEARGAFVGAEELQIETRGKLVAAQSLLKKRDRLVRDFNSEKAALREMAKSASRYDPGVDGDQATLTAQLTEARAIERHAAQLWRETHRLEDAATQLDAEIAEITVQINDRAEEAAKLSLALGCAGPTGVPSAIAELSLLRLEERGNELLAGTGLTFEFGYDRETKSLEPSCRECGYAYRGQKDKKCPACGIHRAKKRADELEILVDDGRVIEDASAKSGGAKVLIGSAIRLAAGLMLRELRHSTANFALIDEPFGSLDPENRGLLAQTFASMLGAVGLEQAFVVSHDTRILDALPTRIEIVSHGERSTIHMKA